MNFNVVDLLITALPSAAGEKEGCDLISCAVLTPCDNNPDMCSLQSPACHNAEHTYCDPNKDQSIIPCDPDPQSWGPPPCPNNSCADNSNPPCEGDSNPPCEGDSNPPCEGDSNPPCEGDSTPPEPTVPHQRLASELVSLKALLQARINPS
jgi:hypothetical protein